MPLTKWSVAYIASWDWNVAGGRGGSKGCLSRIKKSTNHRINADEGWCWTQFEGGRCKMGKKSRPWKQWRLCLCKGGKHCGPPAEILNPKLWVGGNPPESAMQDGKPVWCTACPVSAMQLVLGLQNDVPQKQKHIYRKWNEKKKPMFAKENYGDIPALCNEFFDKQGANEGTAYDPHSGRKSLARWLSNLNVSYEEGFEIHGDLFAVWAKSYQTDVDRDNRFKRRTQSNLPDVTLKAYKRLRSHWNIRKMKKKLTVTDALLIANTRALGGAHISPADLAAIASGDFSSLGL